MSRVGMKPIAVPAGVKVSVKDETVSTSGPKGALTHRLPELITVEINEQQVLVKRQGDERKAKSLHGLTRSLLANMVKGVNEGYEKGLEIHGVGYSVKLQGRKLILDLGFSHPIELTLPDGIEAEVRAPTNPGVLMLRGCDKQLVGQLAASIRQMRLVEPYKGKGIRYTGEQIRRKAGKTFTSAG
jgi:large subunit ribosomal protein L6